MCIYKSQMKNRSLKRLREILVTNGKRMTQKNFAALVGVSLIEIKKVEGGSRMTPWLADKIELATGARLLWGVLDRHGRIKDVPVPMPSGEIPVCAGRVVQIKPGGDFERITGRVLRAYTLRDFERHVEDMGARGNDFAPAIEALFAAAAKQNVLPAFRHSLWKWMDKANKEFGLGIKGHTNIKVLDGKRMKVSVPNALDSWMA